MTDVIESLAAATTPKGLPYPASTDPVSQGAAAIQALALAVDARIPGIYANAAALPASPSPGTIALVRVAADELVELAFDSTLGRWTSRPFLVLPGITGGTSNNFGTFAADRADALRFVGGGGGGGPDDRGVGGRRRVGYLERSESVFGTLGGAFTTRRRRPQTSSISPASISAR